MPVVENQTQNSNVFTYIVEAEKTGAVSYTVSVKDNAGNVSVTEGNTDVATTITVNTALPDAPVVDSYKQKSGATAFKSEDNKYFYKEDGGITFTFTPRADIKGYTTVALNPTAQQITDSITLPAGTHKVYAVDIANNVSLAELELVVVEDKEKPTISKVTIGVNELNNSGGTVEITGSTAYVVITATELGSGIAGYHQITIDTTHSDNWVPATTSSITIVNQSFPNNVPIYIWVKDNAGNISDGFKVTAKDTIAPVIKTHSMSITAAGVVTLTVITGDTDIPATGAYKAVIKIGAKEATGGSWDGGVFKVTVSTTIADGDLIKIPAPNNSDVEEFSYVGGLSYSVTVTDTVGNKSDAVKGGANGPGGGWAYYTNIPKGPYNDANSISEGWYEISEPLDGIFEWADAKTKTKWNGNDDWHLPTRNELNAAYVSLYRVDTNTLNPDAPFGGKGTGWFWSSTGNNSYAWRQDFSDGYQRSHETYNDHGVRVVRGF